MREKVIVATVEETITDDESSYTSEEENDQIDTDTIPPETTNKSQSKPTYNPMADVPNLYIITPSYVPLPRENEHWGDSCEPSVVCEGPEFIQIYGQMYMG